MTQGHTRGHVSFHVPSARVLFSGDSLFSLGCGRLFEGTELDLYHPLDRYSDLHDETLVACAHEYTKANAAFCLSIDPENTDLLARAAEVDAFRAADMPTVPSTLGLERLTNSFLRTSELAVAAGAGLDNNATPAAVFERLRALKDTF